MKCTPTPIGRARGPLLGMLIGVALLTVSGTARPAIRLVYNASDSAPRGWYRVAPVTPLTAETLSVGDMVIAHLPRDVTQLAAKRGYLPPTVPVLKHISAMRGQKVCVDRNQVVIDGQIVAEALHHDAQGRALNPWRGCRTLLANELFLLNTTHPASFDSRYFGPIDVSFVIGKAFPIAASSNP